MVNTDDFIKRLEIILDYYGINASAFADKIGVQRSSLSHLLSGRNKPSLDFILKILDVYPEVDLYWILNGKGSFPKSSPKPVESESVPIPAPSSNNTSVKEDLFSESTVENSIETKKSIRTENKVETIKDIFDDNIEKIVFFYKDGTFKTFNPNQKK